MSRNPSGEIDTSGATPLTEAKAHLASNQLEADVFNQKNPIRDTERDPRIKEPTSATEVPPLSQQEDYVVETFFDELNKAEQAEHEKGVEQIYDKWMEAGEKLDKAFERASQRTIEQFEQHLNRRQKMMEDIAKKREAAEAKKVVDAYKEDMRAALRNLGVSRDHVLASMVEAHLGGVSAENTPQKNTTPERSAPLPERTAFEAPKETDLVGTLEARLAHLSSEADKYPRFSPEREEAMAEMKQIRRELQTIERERNSAKNLKGRLEKARAIAEELGTEEAQALKTELETARAALTEAESGLSAKEEALTKAEQALSEARAKLETAKAAPKPKDKEPRSFDEDPEYNQMLNDLALEYLKTEDKAWFDRNFNGERGDKGHLLDADGNPTPFLPIQNITGAFDTIQGKARAAFEAAQPDRAANYKTWAGEKPGALKKKVTEAHKAVLAARDNLRDHQKNIEALQADVQTKETAYQSMAPDLDAAQERLEKLEGEARAARERKGSDKDAIVQVGKRERLRQEREAEEARKQQEEEPLAATLEETSKPSPELDPDNSFKTAATEDPEETRKRDRREQQNRERKINTLKLDYQFLLGQEQAAERMFNSSDPVEQSIGRQALSDLAKKRDELSSQLRTLGGSFSFAEIKRLKPRPLSNAERRRWEAKYHAEGEEIEGAPTEEEAEEMAQKEAQEAKWIRRDITQLTEADIPSASIAELMDGHQLPKTDSRQPLFTQTLIERLATPAGIEQAKAELAATGETGRIEAIDYLLALDQTQEILLEKKRKVLRKNSTERLEKRLEKLHTKISEALVPSDEDVETADLIESVLLERGSKGPDVPDEEIKRTVALSKPLTPEERDDLVEELQGLSLEDFTVRAKEDLEFFGADSQNPGFISRADVYKKEMRRRAKTEHKQQNPEVPKPLSGEPESDIQPDNISESRPGTQEADLVEAIDTNSETEVDHTQTSETKNTPKRLRKRKIIDSADLKSPDETAHMTEDGSIEFKDPATRAKEEAEAKMKKAEADLTAEVEAHRVKAEARRAEEAKEEAAKEEAADPDVITESEPGAREAAEALFADLSTKSSEEAPSKSTEEAKAEAEALFSGIPKNTSVETSEPTPEPEPKGETPEETLERAATLTMRGLVDLIQTTEEKSLEIRKTEPDPEGMALVYNLRAQMKDRTSTPEKIQAEIDRETDQKIIEGLNQVKAALEARQPDKKSAAA